MRARLVEPAGPTTAIVIELRSQLHSHAAFRQIPFVLTCFTANVLSHSNPAHTRKLGPSTQPDP